MPEATQPATTRSSAAATTKPASGATIEAGEAVGAAMIRRDGRAKVTGAATYTAEWKVPNLCHAVLVQSPVAKGKVKSIDDRACRRSPGFVGLLTHENARAPSTLKTFGGGKMTATSPAAGVSQGPLSDAEIRHAGQIVAVVAAETIEQARFAAEQLKIEYESVESDTDFDKHFDEARQVQENQGKPVTQRKGDPEGAFASAAVQFDQVYDTPRENHNPIEPHATIVAPDGDGTWTVYDATQNVFGVRTTVANTLGVKPEQVRVVCKFVGGAFGSKGVAWPHVIVTALAAKQFNRPVKVMLERKQMYGGVGGRSWTRQRVRIGADQAGKMTAFLHTGHAASSRDDTFVEQFTRGSGHMWAAPNRLAEIELVRLDIIKPTFMRAPGETPGTFALECAMDEMAEKCGMDPIEFRRKNEPAVDPQSGKPFSLRKLMTCLDRGAQMIGWANRNPKPRSMRDPNTGLLVGYGCAAATYPHNTFPQVATLTLSADGSLLVTCGTHEMGTGTTTALSQLAADLMGLPVSRVRMELGDTEFSFGAVSGGSATASSVGTAIQLAVGKLKDQLAEIATADGAPLAGAEAKSVELKNGAVVADGKAARFEQVLEHAMRDKLEAKGELKPEEEAKFSTHSYGAQFCIVHVDEMSGEVRMARHVGVFNCGRILNAKTGRSQFMGGIVMGYGMALEEISHTDNRYGRITNDNIAEYHVPVNADIGRMEIDWLDDPDYDGCPIGAKGVGEIGITGVAAAICNAVYHATGRRQRRLPLVPEHVMKQA